MKRPSFQFYTGDWRRNAKLRRCSAAARGVWVDVLCLFHDAEPEYGVLRWPLKDVATAAGASIALVRELVEKGVLKGCDREAPDYVYRPKHAGKIGDPVILVLSEGGPVWYSSRMVRDEWVRQRRGAATQFTSDNQSPKSIPKGTPEGTPKQTPKGGIGERQGDGPSSSSSSSTKPIPSEAIASGADAPSSKDTVFALGVPLLTAAGVKESNARSFLALQCKGGRDADVAAALEACAVEKPIQPIPWLQTRLNPNAAQTGKHTGFASKDYRAGVTEDGTFA